MYQLERHLIEELRRLGSDLFTVYSPAHRMRDVKQPFRRGVGYIREPAFFFVFVLLAYRALMRKFSVL